MIDHLDFVVLTWIEDKINEDRDNNRKVSEQISMSLTLNVLKFQTFSFSVFKEKVGFPGLEFTKCLPE